MTWVTTNNPIATGNKIIFGIWVEIDEINWAQSGLYMRAQTKLVKQLQEICKDLNISYTLPSQRIELTGKFFYLKKQNK